MDAKQHVGGMIDEAVVGVGAGVAEETLACMHRCLGGVGLGGGEGTDGLQHGCVQRSSVIQQGADDDAEFLGLGGGGWGGIVHGGKLGPFDAKRGRGVQTGGLGGGNAMRADACKEVGDVGRVGKGERTGRAVVVDGEPEERRHAWVDLNVVKVG